MDRNNGDSHRKGGKVIIRSFQGECDSNQFRERQGFVGYWQDCSAGCRKEFEHKGRPDVLFWAQSLITGTDDDLEVSQIIVFGIYLQLRWTAVWPSRILKDLWGTTEWILRVSLILLHLLTHLHSSATLIVY